MPAPANASPAYPPVEVAVALAERSHALAGSNPAARARLAFVVSLGREKGWPAVTRAAHAMREINWASIVQHLGESLDRLQRLDPAMLLARLREAPIPPAVIAYGGPVTAAGRSRESSR